MTGHKAGSRHGDSLKRAFESGVDEGEIERFSSDKLLDLKRWEGIDERLVLNL